MVELSQHWGFARVWDGHTEAEITEEAYLLTVTHTHMHTHTCPSLPDLLIRSPVPFPLDSDYQLAMTKETDLALKLFCPYSRCSLGYGGRTHH